MSDLGDIRKALRNGGYKLARAGRHLIYANAEGHEICMHLGSKINVRQVRGILGNIARGNVKSGKKQDPKSPGLNPRWGRLGPDEYILVLGDKPTGGRIVGGPPAEDDRRWTPHMGGIRLGKGDRWSMDGAMDMVERNINKRT